MGNIKGLREPLRRKLRPGNNRFGLVPRQGVGFEFAVFQFKIGIPDRLSSLLVPVPESPGILDNTRTRIFKVCDIHHSAGLFF